MPAKAILVEHRDDYKAVFGLNLYVYLGIEVQVRNAVKQVVDTASVGDISLIFINAKSFKEDISNDIYKALIEENVDVPIFILGKTEIPSNKVTIFDDSMGLKTILQSMGKSLSVSAKDMAALKVEDYFPMPTEFILPGWYCGATLYKRIDDMFVPLFDEEDIILDVFLDELEAEMITELFVEAKKRLVFVNSITGQIHEKLNDPNLSLEERIKHTGIGQKMVMEQAKRIGVTPMVMDMANDCVDSMQKIISDTPALDSLLKNLMENKDNFLYQHSLLISYIGSQIIQNMPWGTQDQMSKLSYVAFFHDIALEKPEYAKYQDDAEVLADKSISMDAKQSIINHAAIGATLMTKAKGAPFGLEQIIKQHHGAKNGMGLSHIQEGLSPLSVVFILAEEWAHYILKGMEAGKMPAKATVINELNKKYKGNSFKKVLPVLNQLNMDTL